MTREAKVGLMMVAVLVGVFGFLIYKRIHRPMDLRADQRILNEETSTANQDDFPPPRNEITLPDRQHRPSKTVRDAKAVVRKVEELAEDVVEDVDLFAQAKPRKEKPKAAAIPDDFSDDTGFVKLDPPAREEHHRSDFRARKVDARVEPEIVENQSPFDDSDEVSPSSNIILTSSEEPQSDPFDLPAADIEENSEKPDGHLRHRRQLPPDEPFEQPVETTRQTRQVVEEDSGLDAPPQRPYVETEAFESTPRERREAAPHRLSDDVAPSRPASNNTATAHGPKYTIQPNDNFWIISRKRYGAGRYYMALAEHNRGVIPDPKRMMPGVVISTPDVEHLEREHASIIPKPPVADVVVPVGATRSQKLDDGPPGFFVSREGHPMYRVGDKDTLTEIAKVHLNRSTRWVQILEMNRNVLRDGNELRIGTVLRLPADASRVRVAETQRDFR